MREFKAKGVNRVGMDGVFNDGIPAVPLVLSVSYILEIPRDLQGS